MCAIIIVIIVKYYFLQAGVLCQYWDDSEHVSAFKYLSEINTRDAKDLYFDCIWDMNMLEYVVYTHAKRNEHYVTHQLVRVLKLMITLSAS